MSAAQNTVAPVVPPVETRKHGLPQAPFPSTCHISGWWMPSNISMLPVTTASTSSSVRPASSSAARTASWTNSVWLTSSRWLECRVWPTPTIATERFFTRHDQIPIVRVRNVLCFQNDHVVLLAGRAGGSMGERAAGPGDLPALRFAPQLQSGLGRAGQAAR